MNQNKIWIYCEILSAKLGKEINMAWVDLKMCTTNEENRIIFTDTRFGDLVKYSIKV